MVALAYKATDLVKYLVALIRLKSATAKDYGAISGAWNGLLTLFLGSLVGIGVVAVMAHTTWSNQIHLGTGTLQNLPWTSQLVLGLTITSIAALVFDAKKAIDRTDSASTPKLMPKVDQQRRERIHSMLNPAPAHEQADVPSGV